MVKGERIGLVVSTRTVAGVLVRTEGVAWRTVRALRPEEPVLDVVRAVLEDVPRSRRRQAVRVGLAPPHGRIRPLHGVDASTDPATVAGLFSAAPSDFFLGEPARMIPCPPAPDGDGWRAAVLDRELVDELVRVVTSGRRLFRGAVPIAETPAPDEEQALIHLAEEVASLATPPHLFDPLSDRRDSRNGRIRLALMACAMLGAAAAAVVAPTLGMRRYAAGVDGRLAGLRVQLARLEAVASSNLAPAPLLARAATAEAESRALLEALASLAASLPDSGAFTSLRIDTVGGTAILLTPPSRSGVRALLGSDTRLPLRLAGSITTEEVGGTEVQRARVVWRTDRRRTATAPASGQ